LSHIDNNPHVTLEFKRLIHLDDALDAVTDYGFKQTDESAR